MVEKVPYLGTKPQVVFLFIIAPAALPGAATKKGMAQSPYDFVGFHIVYEAVRMRSLRAMRHPLNFLAHLNPSGLTRRVCMLKRVKVCGQ
ncbi:MAG: hypothetical protein AUG75_18660 [Cyanobacteria bacterium 13_1_20CM_4_61_6]|nr:MAG: hypothetical protein AUG75_18660 [Cyanobacteria bacterium 13_1_20CM_4_61_6]